MTLKWMARRALQLFNASLFLLYLCDNFGGDFVRGLVFEELFLHAHVLILISANLALIWLVELGSEVLVARSFSDHDAESQPGPAGQDFVRLPAGRSSRDTEGGCLNATPGCAGKVDKVE